MMMRVKLGMALAVGVGIGFAGPASAQLNNQLLPAVQALSDSLGFTIGSTNNQDPGGNEEIDCPGAVPDGDEDIYDFGQDGVPDYAQMALVEALYIGGNAAVVAAVNEMTSGLKTTPITVDPADLADVPDGALIGAIVNSCACPLPELLEALSGPIGLNIQTEFPTPQLRATLFDQAIDALLLWGVIDNPANLEATDCIDALVGVVVGILTGTYDVNLANVNSIVDGSVVLDDDSTILDKWNEAAAGKTNAIDDPAFLATVDDFVALVLAAGVPGGGSSGPGGDANNPFPPAPSGTPVAAPVGLALLAAGLGLAALRRNRRS